MKKILVVLELLFPMLAMAQLPTGVRSTNGTAVNLIVSNTLTVGPMSQQAIAGPWLTLNSNGNSSIIFVDGVGDAILWQNNNFFPLSVTSFFGEASNPWDWGFFQNLNLSTATASTLLGTDVSKDFVSITVGSGLLLTGTTLSTNGGGGGGGVTSVAQTVPSGFSIAGSPVTTSGTLALTYTAPPAISTTNVDFSTAISFTKTVTSATAFQLTNESSINGQTGLIAIFNNTTGNAITITASTGRTIFWPGGVANPIPPDSSRILYTVTAVGTEDWITWTGNLK